MEKKFSGKIWKFGNDIDTDTIIPGKRGTIPDIEEMKKYAFELLKPEFGSTVQAGDILVAGTNFGCGSSREQAATVLSHNGVRCIIAKSFARIFFRNAFNSGILLYSGDLSRCAGGDVTVMDGGVSVSSDFPVRCLRRTCQCVANGGRLKTPKSAAAGVKKSEPPATRRQCRKTGYTMVEKLLKRNGEKSMLSRETSSSPDRICS
ncbi:MAG: 3-isopropylmalate dehydratase [Enterocloster aldenensis]